MPGKAEKSSAAGGIMDTDWMNQGKCKEMDPTLFFPSDGVGVQAAQRICAECPVKAACLEYALVNRVDHGVWGGASERERRRLLSRRRLAKRSRPGVSHYEPAS